jgi:hypothetical protein
MSFVSLALALLAAAGPAEHRAPAAAPYASTYEEATCATLAANDLGDAADGWDRAAIGEVAPVVFLDDDCRPQSASNPADCDAPQASFWVRDLFVRCDMPRMHDLLAPHPHLVRARDSRHGSRFLTSLSSDGSSPLAGSAPEHDALPAMLSSVLSLRGPAVLGEMSFRCAHRLGVPNVDELLRPPRA